MYETNRIYIWQNVVGKYAHLNGQETMVLGPKVEFKDRVTGRLIAGWPTDTPVPEGIEAEYMYARPGDLRPKKRPPGENAIFDLFTPLPELEPAH